MVREFVVWSTAFFVSLLCDFTIAQSTLPLTHRTFLDAQNNFQLSWRYNDTHIDLEAIAKTRGWLAIGISPNGGMDKSDVMLGWVEDTSGKATVQDRWNDVGEGYNVKLSLDLKQDWTLVQGSQNSTHTTIRATRLLTTCDAQDRPITHDTMRLIYSYNPNDPANPNVIAKHTTRGAKSVLFFSPSFWANKTATSMPEPNLQKMDIVLDNASISPDVPTIYHYKLIKLPLIRRKLHIIGVKPIITPGNEGAVHHILTYFCSDKVTDATEPKEFETNNDDSDRNRDMVMSYCDVVLSAWAIGATELMFPKDVGLPLEPKHSGTYVLMEIHFDNSNPLQQPRIDSSGLAFILTEQLRQYDAAILTTGVLDINNGYPFLIPPDTENFLSSGECMEDCTRKFLPPTGINVLFTMLHSHMASKKMRMRHVRQGTELEPIANDDSYDFNYQESRAVTPPRKILQGDRLIVECNYNTKGRLVPTFGGHGTMDEMCLVYLTYYPATKVSMCGTMALKPKFFELIKYDVPAGSEPSGESVKEYLTNTYTWTADSASEFQNFYNTSDRTALCMAGPSVQDSMIVPVFPQNNNYVTYNSPDVCQAGSGNVKSQALRSTGDQSSQKSPPPSGPPPKSAPNSSSTIHISIVVVKCFVVTLFFYLS